MSPFVVKATELDGSIYAQKHTKLNKVTYCAMMEIFITVMRDNIKIAFFADIGFTNEEGLKHIEQNKED